MPAQIGSQAKKRGAYTPNTIMISKNQGAVNGGCEDFVIHHKITIVSLYKIAA